MRLTKKLLFVFITIPSVYNVQGQFTDTSATRLSVDSVNLEKKWKQTNSKKGSVGKTTFIAPGILMLYGFLSLETEGLESFNQTMKNEMWVERPHKKITIDNYLMYAPAAAVYGLNALGIKGRHNFRDRSMIYLMSTAIMTSSVFGIKKLTHEIRPDGTDYYSFPSGHTAQAFMSAEFLRQEYKDVSPWYGIAGYVVAGTTGAMRMYNNRHWMGDVLAGAGVGIASAKLAYWIYPTIKRKLFKDKPMNTMVMPYYQKGGGGLSMVYHFK